MVCVVVLDNGDEVIAYAMALCKYWRFHNIMELLNPIQTIGMCCGLLDNGDAVIEYDKALCKRWWHNVMGLPYPIRSNGIDWWKRV